mgnify:CR=1 FL=1
MREPKVTVSIRLPKSLVEKAKARRVDISRICGEALSSIFEYLESHQEVCGECRHTVLTTLLFSPSMFSAGDGFSARR